MRMWRSILFLFSNLNDEGYKFFSFIFIFYNYNESFHTL